MNDYKQIANSHDWSTLTTLYLLNKLDNSLLDLLELLVSVVRVSNAKVNVKDNITIFFVQTL